MKFVKGGWGADFLAALAIVTAVYLGEYIAANHIILMQANGQMLEAYAIQKASSVLLALADRMPSQAHRKVDGKREEIQLSDIQIGDNLMVYPHEICPVDGIVLEGYGSMDESYLTGEPYKISKAPGVSVLSGAINGEALLLIQAVRRTEDSRYTKIMKVMGETEQHRPRLRRLADQ
jgi:P-type E1-E2 ATPase